MIVDAQGKPFKTEDLARPQSAGALSEFARREFAGHPSRGLTPAALAALLEGAEAVNLADQADLWLDIREKWGHAGAEMAKRERAILTLDWAVEPPDDANRAERKACDFVREVIEGMMPDPARPGSDRSASFDDVLLGCADAIGHGFSCQEILWAREGGQWIPVEIAHRPQRWFRMDEATRRDIWLRSGSAHGEPLRPYGWIVHIHKAMAGSVQRGGLVRSLAWPYLFANYAIRDLAELLEVLGIPLLTGKHPASATREEKATLMRALQALGHGGRGIMPDTMAVEALNAIAKDNGEGFRLMIDWAEDTASRLITGQSNRDGRTATQSLERQEIRRDLLTTDARQIERTLSGFLLWPLVFLNGFAVDRRRAPRFAFDTSEAEDLKMLADALPKLVATGVQVPKNWVNEKAKIPVPGEGEEVLQAQPAVDVPGVDVTTINAVNKPQGKPAATAAASAPAAAAPAIYNPSPADLYAATLAGNTQGMVAEWVAAVRQAADDAWSLEELKARIGGMFPALPAGPVAGAVSEAMAAANLAGRLDVKRGS